MSIQQVVPITLLLVGDGTSLTFKYAISQLFGFSSADNLFHVVSTSNVASGVAATSSLGHVTASLTTDSPKKILLTFSSAPPAGVQGQVNINLFYNTQ